MVKAVRRREAGLRLVCVVRHTNDPVMADIAITIPIMIKLARYQPVVKYSRVSTTCSTHLHKVRLDIKYRGTVYCVVNFS